MAHFPINPTNPATNSITQGGRKDDNGKMRWSLFPWDAALGILKVMMFGARKYTDRNWEKGMAWSRFFDAAIRHLVAWQARESGDPESGLSHLWHAGCCILFLIAYEKRGIGTDDRPVVLGKQGTVGKYEEIQGVPATTVFPPDAAVRPSWDRDHQMDPVHFTLPTSGYTFDGEKALREFQKVVPRGSKEDIVGY